MHNWPSIVDVAPEVADALRRGQPVVALESAVISHGLPSPTALEASAALEEEIRKAGAVPATVAVLAGRIKVGATARERGQLTAAGAIKIAARDLSVAAALSATGGTTVSATISIADLVGIRVIATGGIGGVHLGAQQTWDVSSDLRALAEHPVVVVCAGAKAICDIGKTLEFLDTAGVTIVAYRTDNFPNFYVRESGFPAPRRADTPHDVARILAGKRILQQMTAVVVANPVPTPHALAEREIADAVGRATAQATAAGVRGGDLTPYLLAALADLTGGRSLRANLALLQANAALAAEVAVAVSQAV
ncbi:MAG TPA: pseudouridine-5'-phosphate glycosidase [bacterium]|nr:pseudouridine-5'-phosphate glycosidase [bacterium]